MWFKSVALGFSLGIFIFTGCGNGSADSVQPTGTIKKSDAIDLQRFVIVTRLDARDILTKTQNEPILQKGKIIHFSVLAIDNPVEEEWEGKHDCFEGGTQTNEIISGIRPSNDTELDASTYITEISYEDCIGGDSIKKTGIENRIWKWKRNRENLTWEESWSGSRKNFIFEINATHKFINFSESWLVASTTQTIGDEMRNVISENRTDHDTYSGTLIVENETIDFRDITRDETYISNEEDDELSWKISGAIKSDKFDGWITIDTPIAIKENNDDWNGNGYCNHAGKITISGINHTVTTEIHSDHSIDIKYNDEIISEYEDCIQYRHSDN